MSSQKKGNATLSTASPLQTDDGAVHGDDGAVRHKDDGAVVEARRRLTFSLLLLQEQRKRGQHGITPSSPILGKWKPFQSPRGDYLINGSSKGYIRLYKPK